MKIEPGLKVFITGTASGIGRATAVALGARGCKLFLTDVNEAGLNETVALIKAAGGEVAKARALDITSYEAVKSFADEIHAEFGPMDIIMNIAGVALFALIEDMTHARFQKVINVNLWGPIHVIECFLPEMIKARHGHVLNVSSAAGLTGAPWHIAYSATKWALVGMSEVLRYDLRQHGLHVTVVCPGGVDTGMKHTVEIPAVDLNDPHSIELKARFTGHAITPEKAASAIITAIEKNRFLAFTSPDIQLVYYLKRFCWPLYHLLMIKISDTMNAMKTKG
jgi:NAD(P)-dependent dehydrogenase (short-subunit alcohol dehydrogenase family)